MTFVRILILRKNKKLKDEGNNLKFDMLASSKNRRFGKILCIVYPFQTLVIDRTRSRKSLVP